MPNASVTPRAPATAVRPPRFSCPYSAGESASLVAVTGELDIATVPQLDRALRRAEAALVVLDLRELEFIDSSGAHLLLAADRRIHAAGGQLVVVRGPAEVEWFFALIGIDRQLELVDQPPAAVLAHGVSEVAPA